MNRQLTSFEWLNVETNSERDAREDNFDTCKAQVDESGMLVVVCGNEVVAYNQSEWRRFTGKVSV